MRKVYLILIIILAVSALINLVFLDLNIIKNLRIAENKTVNEENLAGQFEKITPVLECSLCKDIISDAVKLEIDKLPLIAGQSGISPIPKTSKISPSQANVSYVPLVTDGSTSSLTWTDVVPSEFYFDIKGYPGAKEVRFLAYLLSDQGAAYGYARLYDATNGREVDYSNLTTNSAGFILVESSGIKIWQGNNRYTVQLRSLNGRPVQIKDAKLKIIF